MIDPVATVVKYLLGSTLGTAVGGRVVAGRALYGKEWSREQTAVTVQPAGGTPEPYVPLRTVRLATRCWGPTESAAYGVYLALAEVAARAPRQKVVLGVGQAALLHWLGEASGASVIWDDEVRLWSAVVFLEAIVGEQPAQ